MRKTPNIPVADTYPARRRFLPALLLLLMLLPCSLLWAQRPGDTLREVHVTASRQENHPDVRNNFTAGQQQLHFDTALLNFYRRFSLSTLMTEQSPVFVKSYGVNNMATLSIRGASAAQSQVLWNGIPIADAAMGISDISLLQGGLFQDIRIQYGGASALFGSGNVGGAVLLQDEPPDFHPMARAELSLGAGSFGRWDGLLRSDWQSNRWHLSVRAFYEHARNNFPYTDHQGRLTQMANARLSGEGGILNADYLFPKKEGSLILQQTLSLKAWYQQYDREIPPALFEAFSVKQQRNRSFHGLISWKQQRKRSLYYAKAAPGQSYLHYRDGVVLPDNENHSRQWYAEAGWQWKVNDPAKARHWLHELLVFLPVQWAVADGEQLEEQAQSWRPAVAAAYNLRSVNGRMNTSFSLRREWWNKGRGNWLPGWNGRYRLLQSAAGKNYAYDLSLSANVQRSYRVPYINELYFSPGGNPDLKPERGWNEDGGLSVRLRLQRDTNIAGGYRWRISHQSSLFNRNIQDWIYWLGGAIWTPHNLAEVHSRGVETETKMSWNSAQVSLHLGVSTAYVLATTVESYLPQDNSIGRQIPYTPRYNGIGNVGIAWHGLLVNYNHQYTGYRFTTTDESQYLKPYQVGNLQVSYHFPVARYSFTLSGQLRNIWQERYEVVNGRPMPGRNFLLGLKMGWNR